MVGSDDQTSFWGNQLPDRVRTLNLFFRCQQVNGDSRIVNLHLGSLGGKCRNKQPYIVCQGLFLLKQKIVGGFNQFEDY